MQATGFSVGPVIQQPQCPGAGRVAGFEVITEARSTTRLKVRATAYSSGPKFSQRACRTNLGPYVLMQLPLLALACEFFHGWEQCTCR